MHNISADEKKLVAIMEKYGDVQMGVDYHGDELCSFEGDINTTGNTWMYVGYGTQYMNDLNMSISSIEDAYMALKGVILGVVETIQEENDALNKCQ